MEGEKKHHNIFHHHKEEEDEGPKDYEKELKHHKNLGHLGKAATVAAGAYALHEKHKVKKDPENAHRHKVAGGIAATVALGAAGLTFHEHHEKKEAKKALKEERRNNH